MSSAPRPGSKEAERRRAQRSAIRWLWLAFAVVVLDQATKLYIIANFELYDRIEVLPVFDITRLHNTGAAFSFLAGAGGWQRWFFIGLALAACAFIFWLLVRHPTQKLFCFAIAMVMGGAIGNVIDRIWLGYVVDFLQRALGRLVFPGLQRRGYRHHRRRGHPADRRVCSARTDTYVGPRIRLLTR